MLHVFVEAGYDVSRQFEDGVVVVEFDIDPTEKSLAVMAAREHRAEARSVQDLLTPATVAVIGASAHEEHAGHHAVESILEGGFTGTLYGVGHSPFEREGLTFVPALSEIPDPRGPGRDRRAPGRRGGGGDGLRPSGRARRRRDDGRLRRGRCGGCTGPAPARADRPRGGHARGGACQPGAHEHRPCGLAQRLRAGADAAARWAGPVLPVRGRGHHALRRGTAPRGGAVQLPVGGQPRGRLRQRPHAALGGRSRDHGVRALPAVRGQPAQVLAHRAPALAVPSP